MRVQPLEKIVRVGRERIQDDVPLFVLLHVKVLFDYCVYDVLDVRIAQGLEDVLLRDAERHPGPIQDELHFVPHVFGLI